METSANELAWLSLLFSRASGYLSLLPFLTVSYNRLKKITFLCPVSRLPSLVVCLSYLCCRN